MNKRQRKKQLKKEAQYILRSLNNRTFKIKIVDDPYLQFSNARYYPEEKIVEWVRADEQ